ncbi:uncharacterized protein VTP21DRAFT_5488 [Calcarisporiella thermophila]|uniref:uncharacterized protein n=1 Tax=Calcarisporiella thermophila TaxID=911321 RepID=UPI0037428AC1
MSAGVSNQARAEKELVKIDRTKITPFLLCIFFRIGSHHRIEDFDSMRLPASDELRIYTWKDATLEEILGLVRNILPEMNRPGITLSFLHVYQDHVTGRHTARNLAQFSAENRHPEEGKKTLGDLKFLAGDYLDIALMPASSLMTGKGGGDYHKYDSRRSSFAGRNR